MYALSLTLTLSLFLTLTLTHSLTHTLSLSLSHTHTHHRVDRYDRSGIMSACTHNVAILGATMHAKMHVNRNRKCHRKPAGKKRIEEKTERKTERERDSNESSTPLIRDWEIQRVLRTAGECGDSAYPPREMTTTVSTSAKRRGKRRWTFT